MPHASLKLKPGLDENETFALNEAGFSQSQLVRFIYDPTQGALVQKLGGWTKYYSATLPAVVRALWAWVDPNLASHLAFGTQTISGQSYAQLGVLTSNNLAVVTPSTTTDNVALNLATTAGSSTVTITDATTTGITQYDAVFLQTHIAVGGTVLYGLYQAYNPTSATTYYNIIAQDALANPLLLAQTSSTAVFTGSISGTTLNVTAVSSGIIQTNQTVTGGTTSTATVILGQLTGTVGGIGNYQVNNTQTVSSATLTGTPYCVAAFTTTNGFNTITVTLPNHGYSVGSTYPMLVTTTVGGVTLLYGNYVVQSVPNSWSFVINGPQTATSSTTAYVNSGLARYLYSFGVGANPAGSGYGVNGYGIGGYGTGASISPSLGTPIPAIDWTMDNWGGYLVSCAINSTGFQPIYIYDPTSGGTEATCIPQGPTVNDGIFVAMPQRQIIAWGSSFTGIQDPLLIRWCDVNNFTVWIGQITNQAGSYRLPKGSKIVGAMQGPQQGLIWTDVDVWAMQYVGQPYIYSFNEIGSGCGLIARKAMAAINGSIYWMGTSSFFSLTGGGVQPIPCPIWDVIFQQLDQTNLYKIRTAVNSLFGEITWYYPTTSSGGEVTAFAKYNVNLGTWDFGNLGRSAWIDKSVLGNPIGADPSSLYLYQHETSNDADGTAMVSNFQTGYFATSEGDYKVFIDQMWPDMKWGTYNGTQNATVNITFSTADYPGGTVTTYGPYSVVQGTSFISPRFRARLMSITIGSSDLGSFWRLGNIRYRFQQDGKY